MAFPFGARSGGHWNNGSSAGLFYSNLNNSPSNVNYNNGCRNVFAEIKGFNCIELSLPLGKNQRHKAAFSSNVERRYAENKVIIN